MNLQIRLALEPHPEGGYFRRIYTSEAKVQTAYGERYAASSIHYLLTAEHPRGNFHKVLSTILHYLQSGGPVQYACINEQGQLTETVLGNAPGQQMFLEVPAGVWKSSRLIDGAEHALVSEVVIPAFDWADHVYLDAALLPMALQQQLRGEGWLD